MANTSQTSVKAKDLRVQVPYGQYQYVDVTFNSTAHKDTVVTHDMVVPDPEAVRWTVVQWGFSGPPADPPYVYRDTSTSKKPWGPRHIILRSNIASAQARLLLFIEAL